MNEPTLSGRCLCGQIHYRCGAPLYPTTLCHCESCRRAQGAHAVGWLTVAASGLSWSGERPLEYASSPGVKRGFCGRCGTPLSYRTEKRPTEVDLTLATLDGAGEYPPADHIWMEDALRWDRPADGRPEYPRGRGK